MEDGITMEQLAIQMESLINDLLEGYYATETAVAGMNMFEAGLAFHGLKQALDELRDVYEITLRPHRHG